jgi:chromosome partitioning protein
VHRIAVAAHKGGAGKSTVAVNLAGALAENGARVLVIDVDPQGAIAPTLGTAGDKPTLYEVLTGQASVHDAVRSSPHPRIDVLPADLDLAGAEIELARSPDWQQSLRQALRPLRNYDVALLDTPPGLGVLPYIALTAAGHALVVCWPDYRTLRTLPTVLQSIQQARAKLIGIVSNGVAGRTRHEADVLAELRARHGDHLLTQIPQRVVLEEAAVAGQPISLYAPRTAAAHAFAQLAQEVTHAITP